MYESEYDHVSCNLTDQYTESIDDGPVQFRFEIHSSLICKSTACLHQFLHRTQGDAFYTLQPCNSIVIFYNDNSTQQSAYLCHDTCHILYLNIPMHKVKLKITQTLNFLQNLDQRRELCSKECILKALSQLRGMPTQNKGQR